MHDPLASLPRPIPDNSIALIEQMRFYIEPEISCSRFFATACFTEESIAAFRASADVSELIFTELGSFLSDRMQDAVFIDVPCGDHTLRDQNLDVDLLPFVKKLGADQYVEVDMDGDVIKDRMPNVIDVIADGRYQLSKKFSDVGTREEHSMMITTMQDDLLGFLSKLTVDGGPKTIYISALQPHADLCADSNLQRDVVVPYLHAVYDELSRLCGPTDTIILNSSTMLVTGIDENAYPMIHPALALPERGLDLLRRCPLDKVHVFGKA